MENSYSIELRTDAGMLGVWDQATFAHINDYDSWESELCEDEDILRHISAGEFVPLRMGDGAFGVHVRIASEVALSEREQKYLLVPSRPYLLRTSGRVLVSSLEDVGGEPSKAMDISLSTGAYSVLAFMIDWTQEPGARGAGGAPTSNALPDMIVYIVPQRGDEDYRIDISTFLREDAVWQKNK